MEAVEFVFPTEMPVSTQLPGSRAYMNNGATAAAMAYGCSGVRVEADH